MTYHYTKFHLPSSSGSFNHHQISCSRVVFEKLLIIQLVKKLSTFVESWSLFLLDLRLPSCCFILSTKSYFNKSCIYFKDL